MIEKKIAFDRCWPILQNAYQLPRVKVRGSELCGHASDPESVQRGTKR